MLFMSKQELAIILKNLPSLTPEELEKVRQRISVLLGLAPEPFNTQDWLLTGVTEELRRRGLWMKSYPIPSRLLPNKYTAKSKVLQEFLLEGLGNNKPQRTECLAIAIIATRCLTDWLERSKVPISPRTVLFNLDKIPTALEYSFPGYWAQGLLGVVLG